MYSAIPPWGERLPLAVERAQLKEVRHLIELLARFSAESGVDVGFEDFHLPAVVKPDLMRPALVSLAELLKSYGGSVLGGDLSVLTQVRKESARFERELARKRHASTR